MRGREAALESVTESHRGQRVKNTPAIVVDDDDEQRNTESQRELQRSNVVEKAQVPEQ